MEFPHKGKIMAAGYPFFGPANSKTLQAQIKQEEYLEPTFSELVSFIHRYFGEEGTKAAKIKEIMNTKYFVGFTGILYLPKKNEVYFKDRPVFASGSIVDVDNLESRLKLNEAHAKVSLDNLKTGTLPWDQIPGHPLFIAIAGEEGAEKLAELASKHRDKNGYIFLPDISNFTSPQARIPLLYSYQEGRSLTVSLNGAGYSTNSYSFGLLKDLPI